MTHLSSWATVPPASSSRAHWANFLRGKRITPNPSSSTMSYSLFYRGPI